MIFHHSKYRPKSNPFGSSINTRSYSAGSGFRFGFNTQEKDKEIYNNNETYTATFWEYDGRLGRRWNVDPVVKPWISPFASIGNNPLVKNDIWGLSDDDYTIKKDGTIEVKKTDSKTDDFYKEGEDKPFAKLEKRQIKAGTLKNEQGSTNKQSFYLVQFPQNGIGFTSYESEHNRYVQPEFAAVLFAVGIDWNEKYPLYKINFGDMSNINGDVPLNHPRSGWGHMLGLAVDIRYFSLNGNTNRTLTTDEDFSTLLNQQLVNTFIYRGITPTLWRYISYYNNKGKLLKNTVAEVHHKNHLHIDTYFQNISKINIVDPQ